MTDYKKIGRSLIPWFWRKDVFTAYIESMEAGLQSFHDDTFLPFKAGIDEVLKYNGQHEVLEQYLNNTYDNTLRRIYISENDVVRAFGVDIHLNGEFNSDPIDLGVNGETNTPEVDLGINSDVTTTGIYNFTIFIPTALLGLDENLLRRRIDRWVEAAKRYDIQYF